VVASRISLVLLRWMRFALLVLVTACPAAIAATCPVRVVIDPGHTSDQGGALQQIFDIDELLEAERSWGRFRLRAK
jgi:hypothetical protein